MRIREWPAKDNPELPAFEGAKQLGELKQQGVLTAAEFEQQARIPGSWQECAQ